MLREYIIARDAVILAARQHRHLRRHATNLARDIATVLLGVRPGCLVDYCDLSELEARALAAAVAAAVPITGGNVITAELGGTKYFLNASLLLQRLAILPHDPDASSSLLNVTPVASLAGYPAQDATDVRFRGPCSSDGGVPMPSQSAAQQDSWPTCCERYMQPPQLILFEEDNCSTGATGHSAVKPRAATPVESRSCGHSCASCTMRLAGPWELQLIKQKLQTEAGQAHQIMIAYWMETLPTRPCVSLLRLTDPPATMRPPAMTHASSGKQSRGASWPNRSAKGVEMVLLDRTARNEARCVT